LRFSNELNSLNVSNPNTLNYEKIPVRNNRRCRWNCLRCVLCPQRRNGRDDYEPLSRHLKEDIDVHIGYREEIRHRHVNVRIYIDEEGKYYKERGLAFGFA